MHMLALPIARRELLVLSRAAATWSNRFGTSVVVFGFGIIFALMYHYSGLTAFAQAMRLSGVGLSFVCLFAGASLTADSIAEEKRAGTLGLLFLTNLSPFEIVMGKLVAHGVLGFYTVLCALPLLSMSMIFGGMRFADVLVSSLSALSVLFLSAAMGLLASVMCWHKGRANSLGSLFVMLFWPGFPLLTTLLNSTGAPQWLTNLISQISFNPVGISFGSLLPSSTWTNLVWPHLLGWGFIGMTVWCLPRRWQDKPPSKRRTLRDAWKAICYGSSAARLKLRQRLLDRNAFMWLASRDRLPLVTAWIITFCVTAAFGVSLFQPSYEPAIPIGTGIALAVLLQFALSQAATAQLLREYEQGTLEMILSTPMSAQEVVHGQIAAARRQYRSLFATALLVVWTGIILGASQGRLGLLLAFVCLAVCSGLLLLQFYAVAWTSIWCVVKAAEPKKATSNGFFTITIFPAIMCGAIILAVTLLSLLASPGFQFPPQVFLPLFFVLAFGNSVYWLRRAKRELPDALRLFAFRRYAPPEPVTFFGQIARFVARALHRAGAFGRQNEIL